MGGRPARFVALPRSFTQCDAVAALPPLPAMKTVLPGRGHGAAGLDADERVVVDGAHEIVEGAEVAVDHRVHRCSGRHRPVLHRTHDSRLIAASKSATIAPVSLPPQ